jgi:hypothetical protein
MPTLRGRSPTMKQKAKTKKQNTKLQNQIRDLEYELDAARQIFAALTASRNINCHAYEEMNLWLQKRKEEQS